mmetsp:Transcript_45596/g.76011  ORF Transcript_45596/g.76011 Transcript_45596/m.76011 type:complete len:300 (-) Transcript_45596:199-1098(-)
MSFASLELIAFQLINLINLVQHDVEDEHSRGRAPGGIGPVRQLGRDPEAPALALHHQLNSLGPARDDTVEREADGLPARDAAVEQTAVQGPARVVHLHSVRRFRVNAALPCGEHPRGKSRRGHVRILRNSPHILRRRRRLGFALEAEELDVEHQHAGGPPPPSVPVRHLRGDPEPPLLAHHHQLHTLRPALYHAVKREGDGLVPNDTAIEHLAISGPPGVVNRHLIHSRRRVGPVANLQDFTRKTGRSHLGIGRRLSHVGRRGDRASATEDRAHRHPRSQRGAWRSEDATRSERRCAPQ